MRGRGRRRRGRMSREGGVAEGDGAPRCMLYGDLMHWIRGIKCAENIRCLSQPHPASRKPINPIPDTPVARQPALPSSILTQTRRRNSSTELAKSRMVAHQTP